ncbi:MAG: hypothetical protein QJR14_09515 [Bacillota bacterium]|nr:hypothetical protein [Bacillota bacterium]
MDQEKAAPAVGSAGGAADLDSKIVRQPDAGGQPAGRAAPPAELLARIRELAARSGGGDGARGGRGRGGRGKRGRADSGAGEDGGAAQAAAGGGGGGRPEVCVDDLAAAYRVAMSLIAADAASDKPTLWERAGELVTVGEETDPAGGERAPRIVPMTPATVEVWLAERADWLRLTRDGARRASPPRVLAEAVVAAPTKPAAPLKYVSRVPVVAADGIHAEPGYQPATGVYYWPHPRLAGADLRVDPEPSDGAVRRALELLLGEYLGDFPFVDQASRANALGLLLEPVCRPLFRPPSPLWAIDAPQAGSGKSLLAQALLLPGVGQVVPVRSLPEDETEAGKTLLALLLGGQRAVVWDNANGATVRGDALEAVLTAPAYEGRLLGQSRTARAPNLTTWIITGNNIQYGGTMARRVVPIRIDPRVEEPWTRTGFRHPRLLEWAEERLAELVRAALTLVQAWIAAGRPEDPSPAMTMGSYESWQAAIGGILRVAGVKGFLGNRDELIRSADPEADEWRALVEAWWEEHADEPVGAREVARIAAERGLLGRVIRHDDYASPAAASRMGYALRRVAGRVIGGRMIVRERDGHAGSAVFRLVGAAPAAEVAAGAAVADDVDLF